MSEKYQYYNTGWTKDPVRVLRTYNDGKTLPSKGTISRARSFAESHCELSGATSESDKVKALAAWVNDVAIYVNDEDKYGEVEYWNSPFMTAMDGQHYCGGSVRS